MVRILKRVLILILVLILFLFTFSKRFVSKGYPKSERDLLVSAVDPNFRARDWMLRNGWSITPSVLEWTVSSCMRRDDVSLLRWYRGQPGCPWDSSLVTSRPTSKRSGTNFCAFKRELEEEQKRANERKKE